MKYFILLILLTGCTLKEEYQEKKETIVKAEVKESNPINPWCKSRGHIFPSGYIFTEGAEDDPFKDSTSSVIKDSVDITYREIYTWNIQKRLCERCKRTIREVRKERSEEIIWSKCKESIPHEMSIFGPDFSSTQKTYNTVEFVRCK